MARKKVPDRVMEVVGWLLEGLGRNDILERLREVKVARGDDVIEKAYGALRLAAPDTRTQFAWHLESRRELYRKWLELGKLQEAHGVLVDMAKLGGLYTAVGRRAALGEVDGGPSIVDEEGARVGVARVGEEGIADFIARKQAKSRV